MVAGMGMFTATLVRFGARRGVMNSKMGNKEFYKGSSLRLLLH